MQMGSPFLHIGGEEDSRKGAKDAKGTTGLGLHASPVLLFQS